MVRVITNTNHPLHLHAGKIKPHPPFILPILTTGILLRGHVAGSAGVMVRLKAIFGRTLHTAAAAAMAAATERAVVPERPVPRGAGRTARSPLLPCARDAAARVGAVGSAANHGDE